MGDIKFFSLLGDAPYEIVGQNVAVERSLQQLLEGHLDVFFGMRFLATEYSTGPAHGGRIDTLALDENGSPVIIEYKRATNESVIAQGLFYMTWLMDHKDEFVALARKVLGDKGAESVAWLAPRLVCIAGDYTRYDVAAIQQIDRTIDLVRYKMYANQHLILEMLATTQRQNGITTGYRNSISIADQSSVNATYSTQVEHAPQELRDLFDALRLFLLALGDDVQETSLAHYIAFRRIKNFACVVIHPHQQKIVIWIKANPDTIQLETNFTRDVRNIGHHGTGDLEITLRTIGDLQRAEPLLRQSYEAS